MSRFISPFHLLFDFYMIFKKQLEWIGYASVHHGYCATLTAKVLFVLWLTTNSINRAVSPVSAFLLVLQFFSKTTERFVHGVDSFLDAIWKIWSDLLDVMGIECKF